MKKTYDWNISLNINIQNNNKNLTIICSVHTNIHQLKLQILKKLGMLVFDTEIDLFGGNSRWKPMKPTSSLQQNGIQNNASIVAIVNRAKENKPLDIRVEQIYDKKIEKEILTEGSGLTLKAYCSNHTCVNYNEDMSIHLGFGTFPLYSVISDLKCEKCPYKSQFLRPVMVCKQVSISNCLFKISGTVIDRHYIPNKRETKYKKAQESKNLITILEKGENKWEKDVSIAIKRS